MNMEPSAYLKQIHGSFQGLLKWEDFDAYWARLREDAQGDAADSSGWYLYAVGATPPEHPAERATLLRFLDESQALLHKEHEEEYCGIVYVDQYDAPSMIKIYDPSNLGLSCGSSENPPLPGWILSRLPPIDLPTALQPPQNRQRWWQRILGLSTS